MNLVKQVRLRFSIPVLLVLPLLFSSCSEQSGRKYTDTPTSGDVLIIADDSFQPLVSVELDTFLKIYKRATIRIKYLPETEVFNELLHNDSVRIAITSRKLTGEESQVFESRKIIPRYIPFAIDAVALILNPSNPDTAISYENLAGVISGNIRTWKDLNAKSRGDTIRIVYDRNGSGNSRYLSEKFLEGRPLPSNSYAASSSESVIEYVSTHPSSIGVIGVNWISDKHDPKVNEFLTKIRVMAITPPGVSDPADSSYQPYQAYIALKKYPLTREVMIISREGRNGLGTGFASFLAGDQGQRIVRLMGMLPATMPIRIVNAN
ncbi:MAG: substrate-binding domain-containing protein [Bacteroidia bacterium]|nr:substrate-binding domain-containing protein [Bacteroidia bacterium]